MKSSSKLACLVLGAALVAVPVLVPFGLYGGAAPADAAKVAPKLSGPSSAVTQDILDAVAEEMGRAMTSLQIGKNPKPYHVSYKLTEVDVNDVVASLGYTTYKKNRRNVFIEARVRVGSPDLDNGNFVHPQDESLDGVVSFPLPLEATPRIAARAAWLVTDQAYKEALVQLRAKLEARASSGGGQSKTPSWSEEQAVVSDADVQVPALEDLDGMAARAETISKSLRDLDQVRDSRVSFTSYLERRWYLNSDGTSLSDTRRVSGVLVAALGQADDGQEIAQYYTKYGHTIADLPEDKDLEKVAARLASTLAALAKAPVLAHYTGPVLFQGEGAAGLVRHTLAPHLGGTPLPEGLRPQDAKAFGGGFNDKLNLKVIAPTLTIVDDPTASDVTGKPVIGGYKIDDEGVAPQKIEVVKKGMLTALLKSRTPSAKGDKSNGHARRTAPGGMFHGTATNVILSGSGAVDQKKLVAKLLAEAKANGLDRALIIRQFDDPAITAEPEMTRRELLVMLQNADPDLPPPSLLVYEVDLKGKETLVRGAQLAEVPLRAWKDVLAVGKTQTVVNFLASGDSYAIAKINTANEGGVPSAGIESSVTTPDLLFKELDVLPYTAGQRPKPVVPRPDTK